MAVHSYNTHRAFTRIPVFCLLRAIETNRTTSSKPSAAWASLLSDENTKLLQAVIAGRRCINVGRLPAMTYRTNHHFRSKCSASAALMWACHHGHVVVVRELLKHEKELDVNFVNVYDRTALSCVVLAKQKLVPARRGRRTVRHCPWIAEPRRMWMSFVRVVALPFSWR